MRGFVGTLAVSAVLLCAFIAVAANASPADDHDSLVIVFKDGHRQSLAAAEISSVDLKAGSIVYKDGHREKLRADVERIEFVDASAKTNTPSRSHFIGRWEVGEGNGNAKFFITLKEDGEARKSIGAPHGTWTLVDGEARITWDDGWHDAIRKVGTKHEKFAYEPGKSFSDDPSNVTEARNTQPKPI